MELNVLMLREARMTLKAGRAAATLNRDLSAMRSAMELAARGWARAAGSGLAIPIDAHGAGRTHPIPD